MPHKQSHHTEFFIKGRQLQFIHRKFFKMACQHLLDPVIRPVFFKEFQIVGKIPGRLPVLDILAHHFPVRSFSQLFIGIEELGQILPSSGCGEHAPVHTGLHAVKIIFVNIQIGDHSRMDTCTVGIFFPHAEIFLHVNPADPVKSHHVKLPDRFIVLRRIACCYNDPALGHRLIAEGLALQKLQHGGRKRLRHTVDFINKKDSLLYLRLLHPVIHRGYDLTHGIFCHGMELPAVFLLPDKRQPHGTLPGVVGNGIGYQVDLTFPGDLLHDLCLSDSRRAHQQNGALPDGRNAVFSIGVLDQICLYSVLDLLFCSFNVHL